MSWHLGPMALFDVESTGVDPHRDRIVTASIVEVTPGQEKPYRASTWLLDPGIEIPAGAAAVHGITTEQARASGAPAAGAIYEIAQHLLALSRAGMPVVGHNVRFDLTMLCAETLRHATGLVPDVLAIAPAIDTMVLDRWADPWRPKEPTKRRPDPARCGSRRLVDAARVWGITVDQDQAHGSEYDALLAGRLAWAIADATPGAQGDARTMHADMVRLAREQADSFGAWLVKQGKADDVAREWPIEDPPTGWTPQQLPNPPAREDIPA